MWKQDFPILFSTNESDRQPSAQFTASRLVADAAVEARTKDVQLGFAHRTLEAKQETIVEQRRVVDAVIVADERVGDPAEFQEAIPVGVVSSES